jgi:hypothetical protein
VVSDFTSKVGHYLQVVAWAYRRALPSAVKRLHRRSRELGKKLAGGLQIEDLADDRDVVPRIAFGRLGDPEGPT